MLESPEAGIGKKMDAALTPFAELSEHVFSDERYVRGAADLLELLGIGSRGHQREVGGAVGRGDDDPRLARLAGLRASIEDDLEAEQVEIELQASIEISDVDHHRLQAQEGFLSWRSAGGAFRCLRRDAGHPRII